MRKKIYWIEGDGIGPEIWRAARPVIDAALAKESDLRLDWQELLAGEKAVAETGSPLPEALSLIHISPDHGPGFPLQIHVGQG